MSSLNLHKATLKTLLTIALGMTSTSMISITKADTIGSAGNLLTALVPISAALITLEKEDWDGLWQLTKSEGSSLLITEGLKVAIPTTRPDGSSGSFPSAHTTIVFSAAQYLQSRYGWEYAAPAYAASAFVGWSRVNGGQHYWQDVIAGAAVGMAAGYFFTEPIFGTKVSAIAVPGQAYVAMYKKW